MTADLSSVVVLFDWNGTVVMDADRARASLNAVLEPQGRTLLDGDAFRREFGLPMHDMFVRLGVADPETAECDWNAGMMAASTTAREGAAHLRLLHEAGVRLGVVSAASADSVRADMHGLGLDGLWDSLDAPVSDKRRILAERRGSEPRAFYVGDTVYDMQSAIAAGFVPIAVDRGYTDPAQLTAAGAVVLISAFDELQPLLDGTLLSR